MKERRKFVRVPEQAEISFKVLPNPKTAMFLTRDISQGGIRFYVEEYVSEGSFIEMRLTIKEIPFSFKAVAKIKWVKKEAHENRYEIGVEFVNISQEAVEHLIQYIKQALTRPPID